MEIEANEQLLRLRGQLDLQSGEGFLITNLPDLHWATGFTGSNGCLLVLPETEVLVTDGRYKEQVRTQCPGLPIHIASGTAFSHVEKLTGELGIGTLFLQKSRMSWKEGERIQSALKGDVNLVDCDPMPALRAVKADTEVDRIKAALAITETVFEDILGELREGISEQDIAAEIDYRHRKLGASGPAFDTIVAFSENAALPHARPGKRRLSQGDIVLMDFGGVFQGYHSDMTRTVTFGRADKLFLEAYEAVRSALEVATGRARSGMSGEELDGVARQRLTDHGYGSAFAHSLGHGVGLEIHESPSVSSRNPDPLPKNAVITLEPGVYLPGEFGIRIENMVRLYDDGCTVMNRLGTELIRL